MKFKVGDKVRLNGKYRLEYPNSWDRKIRKVTRVTRVSDSCGNLAQLDDDTYGWWSFKYLKKVI